MSGERQSNLLPRFPFNPSRGATCSGKTTLAKHLNRILPNSFIIHQDVCIFLPLQAYRSPQRVAPQDFAPVSLFFTASPYFLTKFRKPQELIPIHPKWNVQDWDSAEGAIDWPRLVSFLREVKQTGQIPLDHTSHDHLNEQNNVPITGEVDGRLRNTFEQLEAQIKDKGEKIIFGLVDGFLLYWNKVSCAFT